jgi:peptidoglycan/LPS O-acetylase OafA/YrhL
MSQFLSYVHNLRGIAILFVVGVHARGNLMDWSSHPFSHKVVATLFDAQEGNGTVMFLFIAGFLFQHLNQRGFDFKRYLNQKFKVIILPYLIISIPIIIFRIKTLYHPWSAPADFIHQSEVYQFVYHLVTGTHLSPFWFISAIILFYLTAPLFHALDNDFFFKYIFPVVFVVGLFTFRSEHNGNPFLSYLHYAPVYLTGMWASHYKRKIFSMDLRYFYILLGIYLAITYIEFQGAFGVARDMTFERVFLEGQLVFNVYILRAILVCFIFTMLFYRLQFSKFHLLEVLAEYSFGIFFVHFMLIIASRKLIAISHFPVDFSAITFTIFLVIILALSTLSVYLIKKVSGPYSRNLIGS